MKTTQLLREQLGISQQAMAQYLAINQSLLGMYEIGKRDLPTQSLGKLAFLILHLDPNNPFSDELNGIIGDQEVALQEMLTKQAKELVYQQIKEQRTLDAIVKKYNQSINLHRLGTYANNAPTEQTKKFVTDAIEGIAKNNEAVQLQQQIKLQGINKQLEYLTDLLAKYERT